MTTRIHISLSINDLNRSIDYYSVLFGLPPSKQQSDYANFRLDDPPIHLALVQRRAEPVNQHSPEDEHFGFEVENHDSLHAWRERIAKAELPHENQTGTQCCYASGDKVWTVDPDGHFWEIWVRTGTADHLHDSNPVSLQAGRLHSDVTCCEPLCCDS